MAENRRWTKILPTELNDFIHNLPKVDFECDASSLLKDVNLKGDQTYEIKENTHTEMTFDLVSNGLAFHYPEEILRHRCTHHVLNKQELTNGEDLIKTFEQNFSDEELIGAYVRLGQFASPYVGLVLLPKKYRLLLYVIQSIGLGLVSEQELVDFQPPRFVGASFILPSARNVLFNGVPSIIESFKGPVKVQYIASSYVGAIKKALHSLLISSLVSQGGFASQASVVSVKNPYDSKMVFMFEGPSGSGKSEMYRQMKRSEDGTIAIGFNRVTRDKLSIPMTLMSKIRPIADDLIIQNTESSKKRLKVKDAEGGWYISVKDILKYGDNPPMESISFNPSNSLIYGNITSYPQADVLIWNHQKSLKYSANPRVVVPKRIIAKSLNKEVSVDVRLLGVPTTTCNDNYKGSGVLGFAHLLPPALAWLWRLVCPMSCANGKLVSGGLLGMTNFVTDNHFTIANRLLKEIKKRDKISYLLTPSGYIGAWNIGYMPQLLMREYISRRGNCNFSEDQFQPAMNSLFGFEMYQMTLEGIRIPSKLLLPYKQDNMSVETYEEGINDYYIIFKEILSSYLSDALDPLGIKIIETFLSEGTIEDFIDLIPKK